VGSGKQKKPPNLSGFFCFIFQSVYLRPEDLPVLPLSLRLLEEEEELLPLEDLLEDPELDLTVLLLLLVVELGGVTVLLLPEVLSEDRPPELLLLPEELCDLTVVVPLLLLEVEPDGVTVLLLPEPDELLRVLVTELPEVLSEVLPPELLLLPEELCDLTVVPLLLLVVELDGVTVLLLLVPEELFRVELSDDLTVSLRFVVDERPLLLTVPLPDVLLSELLPPLTDDLPLPASGRYTLTELPLTLVVPPERSPLLSSRRTVVLLPVSRSYSLTLGPL
jgi:hypothetical protein